MLLFSVGPNNTSLPREGTAIPTRTHSSAVSNKPKELQLCGGSSRDKTVVKHLVRLTSALPGAVKITDFTCETMNMDFH